MNQWLLVVADCVQEGGMDTANTRLAQYLCKQVDLHVMCHRFDASAFPERNVKVELVTRPFGKYSIGEFVLRYHGSRRCKQVESQGFRVIVNGGNCVSHDVNWVHYVHSAVPNYTRKPGLRGLMSDAYQKRCQRWEKSAITAAKHVICNSELTRRHVIESLGVHPDRAKLVYLGVDVHRFGAVSKEQYREARAALQWDDRPRLLFVGGMGDFRKGFDVLFDAVKILAEKKDFDGQLIVAGAGGQLPIWKDRIDAENLSRHFNLLGYTRNVPQLMSGSDLMVHPARYESYGMGMHEAVCRGLPVITTRNTGFAERYPKELQEYLLDDGESAIELSDRIYAWFQNRESKPQEQKVWADFASHLLSYNWEDMSRLFVASMT